MSNLKNVGVAGGFALPVLLSAVVGVFAIPLLTISVGRETWGLIYLAQTVGQIGGVAVAFGWGATGPAIVAATPQAARAPLFRQSLAIRSVLFLVVAPLAVTAMLLLTRGDVALSVLGGIVYLIPLLGAGWYFVGEGKPMRLLLWDAVPGIAGTVTGVIAAVVTNDPTPFLICQGLGYVCAVTASALVVLRGPRDPATDPSTLKSWRQTLSDQRSGVATSATATLYAGLPVIAVSWFMPASLQATFSLAHVLYRYCTIAFTPIQQFFQSWVPADPGHLLRRVRTAAIAAASIGALGGTLLAALGPFASRLLDRSAGGGIGFELSLPFGVAIAAVCASAVIGLACLVALGRTRDVAISTVAGAIVGAPLILLAASMTCDLTLVAWAFAISELAVVAVQIVALRRRLSEARATG